MTMDNNLQRYSDPTVVDHYEKAAGLEPCEEIIFDHWLKPGMAILDIGVGGGRTAPRLSQLSSRYVGIDYAEGMVAACKRRFPHLDFRHGDATDLGEFRDGEFDAVVFSFNGIDCIPELAGRARAMSEAARVLRPGGVFIVSSSQRALPGGLAATEHGAGRRDPPAHRLFALRHLPPRGARPADRNLLARERLCARPRPWRSRSLQRDAARNDEAARGRRLRGGRDRRQPRSVFGAFQRHAVVLLRVPKGGLSPHRLIPRRRQELRGAEDIDKPPPPGYCITASARRFRRVFVFARSSGGGDSRSQTVRTKR